MTPTTSSSASSPNGETDMNDIDIEVHQVVLWLCDLCLDGAGGECHVPGCAMYLNRAPDMSLRDAAAMPS